MEMDENTFDGDGWKWDCTTQNACRKVTSEWWMPDNYLPPSVSDFLLEVFNLKV